MSKIKKQRNKLERKTVLIIVLLVIATISGILLCMLHISKTYKNNNSDIIKKVDVIQEDTSLKEILEYYDCTNISYSIEKKSDNTLYYKILVRFKHNLYENNKSNKEYFEAIINALNKKMNRSYQLLDNKKMIDIKYDFETKKYTINGVENFFSKNSYKEVEEHKSIERVETGVQPLEAKSIISKNWRRDNLSLEDEVVDIDDEFIDYGSYKMNYTNRNINYIIFNKDYEEELVKGVKIGDSFKKIESVLGKPSFKNSNKMIGYKTTYVYLFFYSDRAVMYPRRDFVNDKLEELLFSYYEGTYEGFKTRLVVDILKECDDFESYMEDDSVRLYSYLRGIEIILNDDDTLDITIYDNYKIEAKMEQYAKAGIINLEFKDDSINLFEQERSK